MSALIDEARLARTFEVLASTDSPSRHEGAVARFVAMTLEELGWKVQEDERSRAVVGSESGNLVARSPHPSPASLFFNAHLDTVEPGRGVEVVFENGLFRSRGETILGGDDKAAVAIMLEVARVMAESGRTMPVEFVFTVCEEIGLLGAKALDTGLLEARSGYALDSTDPDTIINRAPAAIRFKVVVKGRAAHAGLHPEEGVNAVLVAARAMAGLKLGRIDRETTANIGLITGGEATNIVPESVTIEGEVRSHNQERLQEVQDTILGAFHRQVMEERRQAPGGDPCPTVETEVQDDYPAMDLPEDHPLVMTAMEAGRALRRSMKVAETGGGSDANIFNGHGLSCAILGIGMRDVHTVNESIALEDMVKSARLVMEIMERWLQR